MTDASDFIRSIREVIQTELPGERAHTPLMPVNRPYSSAAIKQAIDARKSAVAIVLFPKASSIHSILIERPYYQGIHSKQISFPGGKMDPEDLNLEYTARRECFEEVCLPINSSINIGNLSDVYIPVSNFVVKPFVFYVEELPELIPDHREVEQIITFDVLDLTKEEVVKKTDISLQSGLIHREVPYFDIHGHVVWGATGMMLSELREIIRRI